jgi:acetolactate synthase regulatory subunit
MSKFKDSKEREWSIEITVSSARAVEKATSIDFLHLMSGDGSALIQTLYMDWQKLFDVLAVLLANQMKAASLTIEELGEGFTGTALARAGDALKDALVLFSPRQKISQAMMDKMGVALAHAEEKAIQSLQALDFNKLPTSSPASPALTPTPAASAS